MGNRLRTLLVATLAFGMTTWVACGGGGTPAEDPGPADTGIDAPDVPVVFDEGTPDQGGRDDGRDIGNDVGGEDPGLDGGTDEGGTTCPGGFLCECEYNSDCYSGLCVPTNDKSVCSKLCGVDGICPDGWVCDRVSVGGENVYGCIYPFPTLCQPCRADNECVPQWGAGDRRFLCIAQGPEGRFCGAECDVSTDCPEGYACQDVETTSGPVKQCRPEEGVCECTDKFKDNAYLTSCYNENEFGKCTGTRTCDAECDAKVPAAEACNLEDDDCNGKIDDNVPPQPCELTNAYGTCPGERVCVGGNFSNCQGQFASAEICNGIDDNCNGVTDEGFPDLDGDKTADCVDCDIDDDGIFNVNPGCDAPDPLDNCPYHFNPDQANNDGAEEPAAEKLGDACDPDDDNDGVPDTTDNCQFVKNPLQTNVDGDEFGDACDCDIDDDGYLNTNPLDMRGGACDAPDPEDNCPKVNNPDQLDTDGDGAGDLCDCDADDDGVDNNAFGCPTADPRDNCTLVENPDQIDTDRDGKGDACDCDIDDDGVGNNNPGCPVVDPEDNCIYDKNALQQDTNDNGIGDACDCDIDGDGVPNNNPACPVVDPEDNCPYHFNPDQENTTGSEYGDACNTDFDNDGILNDVDNCPWTPNTDQANYDLDGSGDACDCDIDDDGFGNLGVDFNNEACPEPTVLDNCPYFENPSQANFDGDAYGDACDCDIDDDGDPNPNPGCVEPANPDCDPFDPDIFHGQTERCNGIDDNCNDQVDEKDALGCQDYFYDFDDDGFGTDVKECLCAPAGYYRALESGDCADTNPDRNPGVQERCDTPVDDNCDTNTNDDGALGCLNYYYDGDDDTFGVSDDFRCLCTGDAEYSTRKLGDCNDEEPLINPGVQEVCHDGIDNNCNDSQNDLNAIGCAPYHKDVDDDTWGTALSECRCFAAGDYTAGPPSAVDCDDNDPDVNPGMPEVCNNGKDDNCDGLQNTPGAEDCVVYYLDVDDDLFGVTTDSRCLCAPSGDYTATVGGDCNDAIPTIKPGATEVCDGIDNNCVGGIDENPTTLCALAPNTDAMICAGGICQVATCSAGWFNLDGAHPNGCECQQDASDNTGNTCQTAIAKGTLTDNSAQAIEVTGKIVPNTDEDWFKIVATDVADAGTLAAPGKDKFHVRVKVVKPTDGSIRVDMLRGGCTTTSTCSAGAVDYQWRTDLQDQANKVGQDPCISTGLTPSTGGWSCCNPAECGGDAGAFSNPCCNTDSVDCGGTGATNVRFCNDQSATYYIRVFRGGAPTTSCALTEYTLEISNGLY